jgi:multidrug resistance efflux pump
MMIIFPLRRRRGGMLVGLLVCLVIAGTAAAIGYKFFYGQQSELAPGQLITKLASRGPFDHIVSEQGEVGSSSKTEIICEVKSRGTGGVSILWVIPEGTRVQPGEKLVELDASELELRKKEQKIQVITATAQVTTAEAVVKQAEIAREEYLQGVFVTEEKTILSEMAISEQNLLKAKLAIQSSERLVAKGLVKSLQLDADRFAVSNAQNKLDADKAKLRVLRELTKQKMLVQFDSDIEAAKASLSAARSELSEKQSEFTEIEDQMAKCVLTAPSSGVVVYANKYSGRGGGSEFVVEAGSLVRERQTILYLPDPTKMQVECKINESRITQIEPGMPARITIDAIPGLKLTGRVSKVNRYAEPGGWMSSSTKEYATFVDIIDPPENIRTGMTSNVQIFVEQLDDAVQIPIQGLYEHGGDMYSLKQTGPTQFETVKVTMGATNDTMASIQSGIDDQDRIVLNLREHLKLMNLPDIAQDDTSRFRDLRTVSRQADGNQVAKDDPQQTGEAATGEAATGEAATGQTAGPRGEGNSGAGDRPAATGRPDVNSIVDASMSANDTDSDGKLSKEEIEKVDERFRGMVSAADTNGDGEVSRAELTAAIKKRFSAAAAGGGR